MTTNLSPKGESTDSGPAGVASKRTRWRMAQALLAAGGLLAVGALIGSIVAPRGGREAQGSPIRTSLVEITRQTLSSHIAVDGVLGYGEAAPVGARKAGTVTWLPPIGSSVERGETLYRIDEQPVPLLYGAVPLYRPLQAVTEGAATEGEDVRQLQENLSELGYTGFEVNGVYDDATADAVRAWQNDLGLPVNGVIELGDLVFLPDAARVVAHVARVGDLIGGGPAVLQVTGTTPIVSVGLDPSLQSRVSVGDVVTVMLPDRQRTEGTVTGIGSVATEAGRGTNSGPGAAITVQVALTDPEAAGRLDQAPVSLSITTAVVEDALVVPVTALVAIAGGGHAVEVSRPGEGRELIPVTTGLFDSSRGLVQISGEGISEGQQVVVPGR